LLRWCRSGDDTVVEVPVDITLEDGFASAGSATTSAAKSHASSTSPVMASLLGAVGGVVVAAAMLATRRWMQRRVRRGKVVAFSSLPEGAQPAAAAHLAHARSSAAVAGSGTASHSVVPGASTSDGPFHVTVDGGYVYASEDL
jgi:hypothetical protein